MLLTRLRETQSQEERNMIMHGLTIFCNDQMSIAGLIREGLISTLIQRMSVELEDMPDMHSLIPIKKRDDTQTVLKPGQKRKAAKLDPLKSKKLGRLSPNGYSDPESPTPSGYGSLSNQSPNNSNYSPKSNRTVDDFDSDDVESGSYSPVCSDGEDKKVEVIPPKEKEFNIFSVMYDQVEEANEGEHETIAGEENDFEVPLEDDRSLDKEEQEDEDLTPEMKKWNQSSIKKMLILLRDMRLRIRRVPDLAKSENLAVLLRACKSIPEPAIYCQLILTFVGQ